MKKTTKDDVIKSVEENHIWLNAFDCVSPSPEFCQQIGKIILDKLNDEASLLPKLTEETELDSTMLKMAELTPVLYLSINKS